MTDIDWERIIQEHGPMVWRTAYRLLGRVHDAQECVQETFLSALRLAGIATSRCDGASTGSAACASTARGASRGGAFGLLLRC